MTNASKKPLAASQGQDAYQRLIDEIRTGALRPGDRLTETDLAARLGISRTPVREAIRALEADGLVTHEPRVGAVMRRLDYSEVTELYEMRTTLESMAAGLTARTASQIEIAELQAINDEMRKVPGDRGLLYELNRQFHATMLNAARNRFLTKSVEGLQKTLMILGPSTLEESERAEGAVAEHDAVLAAIRAHDPDQAEALMRRHIQEAHRIRLRQFRNAVQTPERAVDPQQ